MHSQVVYYRDFDFRNLEYDVPCSTHLGVMRNYLPEGMRIQFPKLKVESISDNEVILLVKMNSPGYNFLKMLEQENVKHAPKKKDMMKRANGLSDIAEYSRISMKIKPNNTLLFSETNELISVSYINSRLNSKTSVVKAICISSSPGLWSTGHSYGNTWNVEQLKTYIEEIE